VCELELKMICYGGVQYMFATITVSQ